MAHDIDGPGLSALSLEHLAEMGVTQVGHRHTMQRTECGGCFLCDFFSGLNCSFVG